MQPNATKCNQISGWLNEVRLAYFVPKQLLILLLGFSSGLPLALTASTLTAWLKDAGVSIEVIGLSAAVAMPYSLKFLWAPMIDGVALPFLGRRRGWMLAVQAALLAAIACMAFLDPGAQLGQVALAALIIATLSATQDIVLDAYRVERLSPEELGPGTAMFQFGYRVGMLVAGAGALFIAHYHGWQAAYLVMGGLMGIGVACTLLGEEPESARHEAQGTKSSFGNFLTHAVIAPFTDFMKHPGWRLMLLFIATYKLGDAFLGVMTNPFLQDIGFTKAEIATVVKLYGFAATIIGTFAGGWLCTRYGVIKLLLGCGLLHAITNLMFLVQAHVGADPTVLALGISLENLTGGASSAVLVVFISRLCNREFTATQYALLSSLAAVGRTTLSSSTGYFVNWLDWEGFFVFCVLLAMPSLLMLKPLLRVMRKEGLA